MTRIALLTTGLACLALAGCSGPSGTWAKQGSAPYESLSAQKNCLQQANSLSFLNSGSGPRAGPNGFGSSDSAYMRNQRNDLYRLCMADHGYSKVRVGDEKKDDQK